MINNDLSNQLSRFFNNRAAGKNEAAQTNAAEMYKKLKARQDAIQGKTEPAAEETAQADENAKSGKAAQTAAKPKTQAEAAKKKTQEKDTATTAAKGDENLSPMERRQKELKAIMERLTAEEAARYPNRYKKAAGDAEKAETAKQDGVTTTDDIEQFKDRAGALGFLNDMPLFNEFKTSLMDAFKRLDGATAGSISAQYELNYTSMQYIANAAGEYDYKETSLNIKLDLNYIKAASGGQSGKELADAIGSSTDFASLVENLQKAGQPKAAEPAKMDPKTFLDSMKDYFSPEKTSGRIVDFATAFFPLSSSFKSKGDTEEARTEFAELMRNAIQKGFDQAQGILGVVPKETQDGINKTHELTMKGIDDFIKNGLNKQKQDQGVYNSLEQFAFKFEMSYSEKSVSVRNYNANGSTTTQQPKQAAPAVDTQA